MLEACIITQVTVVRREEDCFKKCLIDPQRGHSTVVFARLYPEKVAAVVRPLVMDSVFDPLWISFVKFP